MGNTSLCLMKLKNYRDASRYLEIMLSLGTSKLKFFLRLAVCYESLGEFQKALDVLEVKGQKARGAEKDEALQRKANYMVGTLKTKVRQEEQRQESLFKKCFDLKKESARSKGRASLSSITKQPAKPSPGGPTRGRLGSRGCCSTSNGPGLVSALVCFLSSGLSGAIWTRHWPTTSGSVFPV